MAIHNKKVLFISAGVITIFVLASLLALLLNSKAVKPRIEEAASAALEMDVRIKGSMSIALFPGFGLSLKDVNVRHKELDVVTIDKIKIRLKLIPLVRFKIKIIKVALVKPVFSISWPKNGMSNQEKPKQMVWGKLLTVKQISISQGSLVFADETSGGKIEIDDLNLSIKNLSFVKTGSMEPFKNITFTGHAECKILRINNFTLMDFVMNATGESGILDFNPVSMNIFGGTGSGSIHVDVTGPLPHYRVIYSLDRVMIEELLQHYSLKKTPREIIEGLIDFSVDLTAMGKSAVEVKSSLNGNLFLTGENLMLYGIDIDSLIMKHERSRNVNLIDVGAFLLAGPIGPALTKSYNFGSLFEESLGGTGIVRKLVSDWTVTNGIVEARNVALATKKQRIAMKGKLNFINERFVDVTIAVLDERGCTVYSENVTGSFRAPQIEKKSIFKSISGFVLDPLEDAWEFIQNEECAVFYSGSIAQPEE